ncbi:SpoIIE family protein phosphatase [Nocardioides sp.]|uniref:GAF domain-containing SpoIIE family protein phosphatase n=1 Tax=Nocardioides sp. TaxID=35761 RepID=UPI00286D177D|nr:SpoIIE family protein phosphatase [Nocardioides sp.]
MMQQDAHENAPTFDHYARLVRRLLHVPIGLVSLVEPDRQVFRGAAGLPGPLDEVRETPLSHSFCQYVVKDASPLVISDARLDARLAGNLAIEELDVIAYAGWPLTDVRGEVIGSLCAIDSTPRTWTPEDLATLEDLAAACSAELGERERQQVTAAALAAAEELHERSRALLALSTGLAATDTLADVAESVATVSREQLGCQRAGMWLRASELVVGPGTGGPHGVSAAAKAAGETLTFIEDTASSWRSAARFAELPLGHDNPLGAALADQCPVFFATRAAQNERYPHLANPAQLGEARAFVPLVAGGRAYGALALVWPTERTFSEQDRITIEALASYTAQAVQRAILLEDRSDVALTLQNAMLTSLPEPPHLDLAARYRPAGAREQVGGDWYDAVVTRAGWTDLMIGDVIGHDIEAAAVMGQLRSMLRMASWMSSGAPSHDLQRLDLAMRDLGLETIASAVLARVEEVAVDGQPTWRLRWSNAGHLPPLVVGPDGDARFLDSPSGSSPLLGVAPETVRHDDDAPVLAGSLLLLYTDGLLERRSESLDVGLARLRELASRTSTSDLDAFLDQLLAQLGGEHHEDDVALLAVRFGPLLP